MQIAMAGLRRLSRSVRDHRCGRGYGYLRTFHSRHPLNKGNKSQLISRRSLSCDMRG